LALKCNESKEKEHSIYSSFDLLSTRYFLGVRPIFIEDRNIERHLAEDQWDKRGHNSKYMEIIID